MNDNLQNKTFLNPSLIIQSCQDNLNSIMYGLLSSNENQDLLLVKIDFNNKTDNSFEIRMEVITKCIYQNL